MTFQIQNSVFLITAVVLIVAVIALILILVLLKLYQVKSRAGKRPGQIHLQGTKGSSGTSPSSGLAPEKGKAVVGFGKDRELHDEGDISKNMKAFIEKYGFDSFTLSSEDGLVIASTSGDSQGEAANYSQLFRNGVQSPEPGTTIFGISHHGSTIIGIVKSGRPVPVPIPAEIESDATSILRWSL